MSDKGYHTMQCAEKVEQDAMLNNTIENKTFIAGQINFCERMTYKCTRVGSKYRCLHTSSDKSKSMGKQYIFISGLKQVIATGAF